MGNHGEGAVEAQRGRGRQRAAVSGVAAAAMFVLVACGGTGHQVGRTLAHEPEPLAIPLFPSRMTAEELSRDATVGRDLDVWGTNHERLGVEFSEETLSDDHGEYRRLTLREDAPIASAFDPADPQWDETGFEADFINQKAWELARFLVEDVISSPLVEGGSSEVWDVADKAAVAITGGSNANLHDNSVFIAESSSPATVLDFGAWRDKLDYRLSDINGPQRRTIVDVALSDVFPYPGLERGSLLGFEVRVAFSEVVVDEYGALWELRQSLGVLAWLHGREKYREYSWIGLFGDYQVFSETQTPERFFAHERIEQQAVPGWVEHEFGALTAALPAGVELDTVVHDATETRWILGHAELPTFRLEVTEMRGAISGDVSPVGQQLPERETGAFVWHDHTQVRAEIAQRYRVSATLGPVGDREAMTMGIHERVDDESTGIYYIQWAIEKSENNGMVGPDFFDQFLGTLEIDESALDAISAEVDAEPDSDS